MIIFTWEEEKSLGKIQTWLEDNCDGFKLQRISMEGAGGSKGWGSEVWAAAFNHFRNEEFVNFVKQLRWEGDQAPCLLMGYERMADGEFIKINL
jgi:hypothetical protein